MSSQGTTDTSVQTTHETTLLHVGAIHYASSNITARRKAEFHRALQEVVQTALDRDVGAVLITGQLFATQSPAQRDVDALRETLGELRDAGVPLLLAGSSRDQQFELVERLADEGLVSPLSRTPVVVGDVAVYGTPSERSDPLTVARSLDPMPTAATTAVFAISGTVSPPVTDADVSLDQLQRAASVPVETVLAGDRRHRRGHPPTRVEDVNISQIGPTEQLLRKWVLDQPPVYPRTIRLVGPTGTESISLSHRPLALYRLGSPSRNDLATLETKLAVEDRTVLVQLQGPRGPDPLAKHTLSEWLADQTTVSKVWDERTDDTTDQPLSVEVASAAPPLDREGATPATDDKTAKSTTTTSVETAQSTTTTSDERPRPNAITESYIAFWSMRTVVEGVLAHDGNEVYSDTDHPLSQYRALLNKFTWGSSLVEETIPGYGTLQKSVVPFAHREYREAYGDGDWVTAYQCVETAPFSDVTQDALAEHNIVDDPAAHVRPVAPVSGEPLPEAPTTATQLRSALELLSEFPIVPDSPWALNTVDLGEQSRTATYPMARLYDAYCRDINITPTVDFELDEQSEPTTPSLPDWLQDTPAAKSSPATDEEISSFLTRHGKLTHLYREVTPPASVAVSEPVPVFSLDQYRSLARSENVSQHSLRLYSLAKEGDRTHFDHFVQRLRDLLYRRILTAAKTFDLITVYPGHEAGSVNDVLGDLAREMTEETQIIYAQLLERTETVPSQKQQGRDGRWETAAEPSTHLSVSNRLDGRSVLLLDDICTSGASLAAGAYALRAAGAELVVGLTLGSTHSYDDESVAVLSNRETTVTEIRADDG